MGKKIYLIIILAQSQLTVLSLGNMGYFQKKTQTNKNKKNPNAANFKLAKSSNSSVFNYSYFALIIPINDIAVGAKVALFCRIAHCRLCFDLSTFVLRISHFKLLHHDEYRKETESQGFCLNFLLCHPVPHTQAQGKERRSQKLKKPTKKKQNPNPHKINWVSPSRGHF